MKHDLRLARPYLVLLAIMAVARFAVGNVRGIPYAQGTDKVSIVILTLIASILYAAFARGFLGYRIWPAARLAMVLGLASQVVIVLATVASYAAGAETYFNHPIALNQPQAVGLGPALGIRLGGLVVNTLANGIAGMIGWALGALFPEKHP
jgi:hypothetical protein